MVPETTTEIFITEPKPGEDIVLCEEAGAHLSVHLQNTSRCTRNGGGDYLGEHDGDSQLSPPLVRPRDSDTFVGSSTALPSTLDESFSALFDLVAELESDKSNQPLSLMEVSSI